MHFNIIVSRCWLDRVYNVTYYGHIRAKPKTRKLVFAALPQRTNI